MNFNYRKVNRIRKLQYKTKRDPVSFPSMKLKGAGTKAILGDINDIPIRHQEKHNSYNFIKGQKQKRPRLNE